MIKKNISKLLSEEFKNNIDKIHKLKDLNKDAFPAIDDSFKRFSGMSSSFINSVSMKDLLNFLKTNNMPDGNKLIIVSALLFEEGTIFEDNEDNISEAFFRYERAFNLIYTVFNDDLDCDIENYTALSDTTIERLTQYELSTETMEKLFKYFKITENYAKADDCLYELMNSSDSNNFKETAINFYHELLSKSDEDLLKGNLKRSEVEEYLKELS
ncbi:MULTISPECIES: DUF6483 family protein [Clostridium]|uniref:DUF6483 family protein n=1 Tax=Clostridium TaxID=1485 RepID=UPI000825D55D|nr:MULTISPECIES: DUF6483 family protein [Clostridium]PJI07150.1 hypothetical protein CUB90_04410 [Clostridium sp. CT7]